MALFDTPRSLVDQAKDGDAGPLYQHLRWPLLMWYTSKGLTYDAAEDLASVLWITVLRNLTVVDDAHEFAPWFTTLVVNKLKNYFRDQSRRWVFYFADIPEPELDLELLDVVPDPSPDPLAVLEAQELSYAMEARYRKLSPEYQEVLGLRVSGHSPREIMSHMGWVGPQERAQRVTYKARLALRG